MPAQLELAGLQIRLHDTQNAEPHLEYLEKTIPDEPLVIAMRLDTLNKEKDKDKVRAVFDRLPENSDQRLLQKAQVAMQFDYSSDAPASAIHASRKEPGHVTATLLMAREQQKLSRPDLRGSSSSRR